MPGGLPAAVRCSRESHPGASTHGPDGTRPGSSQMSAHTCTPAREGGPRCRAGGSRARAARSPTVTSGGPVCTAGPIYTICPSATERDGGRYELASAIFREFEALATGFPAPDTNEHVDWSRRRARRAP